MELENHKAILGYPWFTNTQPKIDWRRGWIDHTQLPIILQSVDAQRTTFLPKGQKAGKLEQYYIR
jgi:hypothetical protein